MNDWGEGMFSIEIRNLQLLLWLSRYSVVCTGRLAGPWVSPLLELSSAKEQKRWSTLSTLAFTSVGDKAFLI